jgi:mono/diheme cytochrome c family protein
MSTTCSRTRATIAALVLAGMASVSAQAPRPSAAASRPAVPQGPGLGVPATDALIASWDVSIPPDGTGLPAGSGTVAQGAQIFNTKCIACHGPEGAGSVNDRLVGGQGTLTSATPVKTIGSYWPYATTLFDYVRRAMPLTAPQSLSNEDVYAVCAYVLYLNGLVPESAVIDGKALTALRMPNRDGFVADPRPDVKNADCMTNCTKTP